MTHQPRALDLGDFPPAPAAVIEHPPIFQTEAEVRAAFWAHELSPEGYRRAMHSIKFQRGQWVPGCNGSEVPFTYEGRRYLYCWHTGTGEHAYLDLDTDMPMPADWHPGR